MDNVDSSGRLDRAVIWVTNRFGFRRSLNPAIPAVHRLSRELSKYWFEGLKRIAALAALAAAAKKSELVEIVYWATLLVFMMPIGTWIEQWQPDFRRRGEPGQSPSWSYNLPLALIASVVTGTVVNIGVQTLVIEITSRLTH